MEPQYDDMAPAPQAVPTSSAMLEAEMLQQAELEAAGMVDQAVSALAQIDGSAAGKLLAMTHTRAPGAKAMLWIPKRDISAELVDKVDKDGNDYLVTIGKQVMEGYRTDKKSRGEWEDRSADAMKAALQVTEEKTFPWADAANVKLPLITSAAIQFHARAYPALVPPQQIVKGVPQGEDPDGAKMERGDRIGKHMSWQVTSEMPNWEEETDKLVLNVGIVGCAFRKTYYDHTVGKNRSEMVTAMRLVVNHKTTRSLDEARRISEEVDLYENDIIERQRSGTFREVDLALKQTSEDDDPVHQFIECHTWYDLDGDGYREPYICVVHVDTETVVRIRARFEASGMTVSQKGEVVRIEPEHYYTKYALIPNPDGGFYDIGLGYLLQPLNASADTVMNQLLDAGTLQNTPGGFIGRGLRMKGGPVQFTMGEFKTVDAKGSAIKDNIVPITFPGPSTVLFQLLGVLIEMCKEVGNVKDVLTGDMVSAQQSPTTTLAMIDQGLKVFTAIYKRMHRSLGQEFQKIYRLNGLFLKPQNYFTYQDAPMEVLLDDYRLGDLDIVPITDPSVVAGPIALIKAQALIALKDDPRMNGQEIIRRYLEALEQPNIDKLFAPPSPMSQQQAMMQMKLMGAQIMLLLSEAQKNEAQVDESISKAIKNIIESGATALGMQLDEFAAQISALSEVKNQGRQDRQQQLTEQQAGAVSV